MSVTARHTLWASLAALISNLALLKLSADARLLPGIIIFSGLMICLGLLMRWRGERQLAASMAGLVIFLTLIFGGIWWAGSELSGGLWDRTKAIFISALDHMETGTAPMEPHDGVLVILLAIAALVVWLTDVFYVAGRLVIPAIGVLVVPYLVVAFVPKVSNHPAMLAALLVACLTLTAAMTRLQSFEWANLVPSTQQRTAWQFGYRLSAVVSSVAWLAVPAVALALVAGMLMPADGTPRINVGELRRTPIQLTDPTIRLNENLRLPQDRPLLSYQTNQPGGVYLRNTALVNVHNRGWTLSDMKLQRGLPEAVPGLDFAVPAIQTSVTIGDFDSSYLPAPYAPLRWDAPGRWSFDPLTMTVIDTRRSSGSTTVDLAYTVMSTDSSPNFEQLRSAQAGIPDDAELTRHIPADIPPQIVELAKTLTADAETDGEKALALQNFFREPGRFSYSLAAPSGAGFAVLTSFIFDQRSGYCIHFASAMALMSRAVGIPSRVAVGFTPGELQADGSYLVSAHDMHAWPELFFAGLGWVRFEPTVSVGQAPAYTSADQQPTPDPLPVEPEPQPEPTSQSSTQPTDQPADPEDNSQDGESDRSWLGWLAAIALLGLLVAMPQLVRSRIRAARLGRSGPDGVHGLWTELAASYLDYRRDWPVASPRSVAARLTVELDEPAAAALDRLAQAQERALYSDLKNWSEDLTALRCDLDTVTARLTEEADGRRRLAAKLWPASLFSTQLGSLTPRRRSA